MYDRFAAVSKATRDVAAAAEIRFVDETYDFWKAREFARRNADRVTSLGACLACDFASIRMYSQLRDLDLALGMETGKIFLLPPSLTKVVIGLTNVRTDWRTFRPLCCLQELQVCY